MEDPVENVSVNTSPTEQAAAANVFGGDEAVANTPPAIPVVSEVVAAEPAPVAADALPPQAPSPETIAEPLSTVLPGVKIDQATLQQAVAQLVPASMPVVATPEGDRGPIPGATLGAVAADTLAAINTPDPVNGAPGVMSEIHAKLQEIEDHAIFWGGEVGNKMRNLICEVRNLL